MKMGFAKDPADATANSPAVPKVGFVTAPASFTDISGKSVDASEMDVCARVISVFKCHKAPPADQRFFHQRGHIRTWHSGP